MAPERIQMATWSKLPCLTLVLTTFSLPRPCQAQAEYPQEAVKRLYELGVRALRERVWRDAVGYFSEALRLAPQHAKSYARRAEAFLGMNDLTKAANDATKAIELDSKLSSPYAVRGAVLTIKGDY
jgi:Tfp pilus assembly protein PilF